MSERREIDSNYPFKQSIGTAFANKNGSINAILDVFPRDGKIQIRDRRERKDA